MNKKKLSILLVSLLALAYLTGCAGTSYAQTEAYYTEADAEISSIAQDSGGEESTEVAAVSSDQENTQANTSISDQKTEYTLQVTDINLSDYDANSVVKITAAGEYTLSGTLVNGQVLVEVGDEEEVQLYLDNATITNNSGSAILVENAEKVIITLNDGTVNTVTDGSSYSELDGDGEADAAIFSHDDLTIKGGGSLIVQANYSDGIESRDDLKIKGGNITVTAVNIGLFGNNSFEMEDAVVVITSGGDAIHSDGDILVESGTLTLSSGDDAMHADGGLTINDGVIDIQMSYEGLEAMDVVINGGVIDIVSSDDGINGAGGNDNSGFAGFGGGDNFGGSQCSIILTGGTITITAGTSGNGDGLDANGTITVSGGDLVIKEPATYRDYTNIDYNASFSLTGGRVRILNPNGTYTEVTANYVANQPGPGGGRHR